MESFKNSMAPPIDVVEDIFRSLNIDGNPIEVRKYSKEAYPKVLMDALLCFDYGYRYYIKSKAELKNMHLLHEFLLSKDYFMKCLTALNFGCGGRTGAVFVKSWSDMCGFLPRQMECSVTL